jgi:hypothetical protein
MPHLAQVTEFLERQGPPRPPIGATIKKGESKEEAEAAGRKMPKDRDYFRLHPADGYEHLADLWTDAFGPEPKSFRAILPFDEADRIFETSFKLYGTDKKGGKGSLNRLCDGRHVLQTREHAGQFMVFNPTDATGCPIKCCMEGKHPAEKPECGARLQVEFYVEIPEMNQPLIYKIHSGAWFDVQTIGRSFMQIGETIRRVNQLCPDFFVSLQGIPIVVSRREQANSQRKRIKGDGGGMVITGERSTRIDHNIFVEFDPDYYASVSMIIQSQQRLGLAQRVQQAAALTGSAPMAVPQLQPERDRPIDVRAAQVVVPQVIEETSFWRTLNDLAERTDTPEKFDRLIGWIETHKIEVVYIRDAEEKIDSLLVPLVEMFGQDTGLDADPVYDTIDAPHVSD